MSAGEYGEGYQAVDTVLSNSKRFVKNFNFERAESVYSDKYQFHTSGYRRS